MNPSHNWQLEKQSAYLYRVIAQAETAGEKKTLFEKLANEAEKQAAIWESKLTPGLSPTHFNPSLQTRLAAWMIRRLGLRAMRPVLSALKVRGMSVYHNLPSSHAKPDSVSQVGSRHHQLGAGNWLRATVFGANDGLVSNASLILGVTGAAFDSQYILLSGVAGMVAGAFSMACGEYISVQSQREFFEKQLAVEKEELELYPEEEAAELALIFEARGLKVEDAERTAKALIADPEKALDTLAREELGLNPRDLGSPILAALSSFGAFLVGAFIPLIPFLFHANHPEKVSIAVSVVALFAMGCALSLFTGRSAIRSGLRMVLLGGFAGACTYFFGRLLGVQLS